MALAIPTSQLAHSSDSEAAPLGTNNKGRVEAMAARCQAPIDVVKNVVRSDLRAFLMGYGCTTVHVDGTMHIFDRVVTRGGTVEQVINAVRLVASQFVDVPLQAYLAKVAKEGIVQQRPTGPNALNPTHADVQSMNFTALVKTLFSPRSHLCSVLILNFSKEPTLLHLKRIIAQYEQAITVPTGTTASELKITHHLTIEAAARLLIESLSK